MERKNLADLRSQRWFGQGPFSFEHRAHAMQAGIAPEEFEGRPVIAVVNTWSDLMNAGRANPAEPHRTQTIPFSSWTPG